MPLYVVSETGLEKVQRTDFISAQMKERSDLQRILRDQVQVIDDDLYVISEEFGRWEEGSCRIDLLAIDRNANIVVIELKRTEHGGHMELQAIRYAAMVANMTFDQAVRAHTEYIEKRGFDWDAEQNILGFLEWEDASEEEFGPDVRILLVSGDFSRELTTSVLWLIDRELDIRCVRLRPHKLRDETVLQVEQVLPLPEAQDYMVGVREKQRSEAKARNFDRTRFDVEVNGETHTGLAKRQAIMRVAKRLCDSGVTPTELTGSTGRSFNSIWRCADGRLNVEEFAVALETHADSGGPAFDPRRWFISEDFIIHSEGQTWAFTKMWGINTEDVMMNWIHIFPDAGITVRRSGK